MKNALRTASLLASLSLAACGGGGGGGGAPVAAKDNLAVEMLQILSPDPTSAHELDVSTSLLSVNATKDVSISYYLIHKGDMDQGVKEPRQFMIDTDVIAAVPAGASKHHVTLIIPKTVQPRGEYFLTTKIDPMDQIEESNEDDNVPPESQPDIVMKVNLDNLNTPDFTVESVTLDDPAMVLQKHIARRSVGGMVDRKEHHGGLTVVCQVTGAKDYNAVSLRAEVETPGGRRYPLGIWREDRNVYETTYYADVIAGQPNSVHVDLNVPDSTIKALLPLVVGGLRNFNLKVSLNVGNSIPEWENGVRRITQREDDIVDVPLVLVDPSTIPSGQCHRWEQDFKKDWHNKVLGAGVRFHGGTYLDGRGAVAEARGSLPVKIFKTKFDFFQGEAYGQLSPHKASDTQFHIDVDILGVTVYQRASRDPKYVYRDTPFKKVETVKKKTVVFCGPVPIVMTAGAQGTLGYDLEFKMDSGSMSLAGTPYAELTAFASAVVHLGIAKGGVRGKMTLIRDDYVNKVTFGNVKLVNNGAALSASMNMTVTNILTGPKGRLYLFADYPGVKWCKTFLGRVPCGVRNIHKEKTLVKFRTFQKRDVLLNETLTKTVQLNCK